MQRYFQGGVTRNYKFRRTQLQRLKSALFKYENEIYNALYADLKKNKEECWITELGFVITEINYALKHLHKWLKPQRVKTNLLNFPSRSFILHEPLGVVLIIAPWNYPVQLLLTPLVGAIAAGNCVVLKPSEFAPATASVLQKIFDETFSADYIKVVQGDGATVIPEMMNNFRFDHVFYTGSTQVGKNIYEMAAKQLTSVTLELGGKSPCIVEADANIKVSAKRIALTKFSNAGQMCVAPDYVLAHEAVKQNFIGELKNAIHNFYNSEEARDYYYGKIINEKQFHRLVSYIKSSHVIYGGNFDAARNFIEPTLVDNIPLDAPVMKDEIFGPVLPVISWKNEQEVHETINHNPNPLAFYVFTSTNKKAEKWMKSIPFGSG
ncbi:MAG: aldehyde dehydrogenase family protein, partial [Flavisolibacter sp.]|nr:aldehyde dehydrogenase family protein [Flavisolibacter sp.]